jgi:hypothetical protein
MEVGHHGRLCCGCCRCYYFPDDQSADANRTSHLTKRRANYFLCFLLLKPEKSTIQTNMIRYKFIKVIAITCACVAVSSLNAATVPTGTTLTVSTASSISSQDPVGRTFAAKLDQDVTVNGSVLLKAGTKAFGKITASRANPRKNEPLGLELTTISVNGRSVTVKTDAVQPGVPVTTGRQARYGHTAGTLTVTPGTKLQFRLARAVAL